MKVRNWATFTSDLPEDQVEDEEGREIVQFGGKSVIEAVAEILTRLGCIADLPRYADEHGWEMHFTFKKRRFWCQVTLIEGYLMVVEDISFFHKLLGRQHPFYLESLTNLARELARDQRFHNVEWFLSNDVLSGVKGADEPIEQ